MTIKEWTRILVPIPQFTLRHPAYMKKQPYRWFVAS